MKREFNLRKIAYIVLFFVCVFLSIMYGCNKKNESIVNNDILSLDKNAITVYIDETITITANIEGVTWTSDNETIATVKNGVVTGIKFGKTVITATKGEQKASCEVTVKEKLVSEGNFYLTAEKTSIFKNRSISISAIMYFGEQLIDSDNLNFVWTSSNENIATVDQNGRVTGINVGNAIITCTVNYNNKEYTDTTEIEVEMFTVLISDEEEIRIASGNTLSGKTNSNNTDTFTFKVYDENENLLNINMDDVTYSSSDNNIVMVDEKGKLTAINTGKATVTASYGNNICSVSVKVITSINCIDDMDTLAYAAKNGNDKLWDSANYYILTNDIDYNNNAITPIGICGVEGYSWRDSFGNLNPKDRSFDATFDGNGYTIKNALIAEALTSGTQSARNCIFGYITGTVKNICFDKIRFETQKTMINSGIFSQMYGTVESILVLNGDINANAGDYNEGFMASAFLAGTVHGIMKNCIVEAEFSANGDPAIPGLIYSYGTENCTLQDVYAVSATNCTWVHYHSSGVILEEDTLYKYNTEADLNTAHPEMFSEDSVFAYDETNGISLR